MRKIFLLLPLSLVFIANSNAQEKKDKVILYNSVPVEVEVDKDGNITKFKQEKKGYLKNYIVDTKPNDPSKAIADLTALRPESEFGKPISPERNFLNFDAGENTLDAISLDVLNKAIARLKAEANTRLTIKASNPLSEQAKQLNEQRLASCKQYLLTQGIEDNRILTTLSQSIKSDERVTLTFTVE